MKIRGFIITGVLLLGSGIGLTGYATTREDFNKEMFIVSDSELTRVDFTKEDTDKIDNIKFVANMDGLLVVPSDSDCIKLDVKTSSKFDYEYEINEETNTLEITQITKNNFPVIPINFGDNKTFTIYLPKSVNLEANVNSGGVVIRNTNFNNLKLDLNAGGLDIENSTITTLNTKVSAGGVELKNVEASYIDASVSAGGLDFRGKVSTEAHFKVSAGGLNLSFTDAQSNYKVNGVGDGDAIITYEVSAGGKEIKFQA